MKTAIKRIITIIKWLLLIIFALTILTLVPLAFLIGLIAIFFKTRIGNALDKLAVDFKAVAYTLDVLGCITIFNWLWFLFKSKDGYKFGNINETVGLVY